jgi:hypothetical protein
MPTTLDYERLKRRVADLEVENALLKGENDNDARRREDRRWDIIEEQPLIGTPSEERRLRRVIRGWEERYDILAELYYRQGKAGKPDEWYQIKQEMKKHQPQKLSLYTRIKNFIWRAK